LGIVHRFEEAKEAGALVVVAIVFVIDLGGYAADYLGTAPGKK
jgi:hypothetical protein